MTKEVSILSTSGKQVGQIALDDKVFGVEPNLHVMHMALRRQLNNARGGNACAKTRAEVSGGGRKPWKPLPIDVPVTSTLMPSAIMLKSIF